MNVFCVRHVLSTMLAAARIVVLAGATIIGPVTAVPAFAQTDTRTSLTAARAYVPVKLLNTADALPPNLIVPRAFRSLVEDMLRTSPTFRRQCARIAGQPHVAIRLLRASRRLPAGTRAVTQIARKPLGMLEATVEVPASGDDVELIAHELEHIIEQIDEVDLSAAASRTNSGVHLFNDDPRMFETTRATRVGLLVVEEFRLARR